MGDLDLTGLENSAGELESVVDSAILVMDTMAADVLAAKDDPVAVAAVVSRYQAAKERLAAAVVRNTPAAPET